MKSITRVSVRAKPKGEVAVVKDDQGYFAVTVDGYVKFVTRSEEQAAVYARDVAPKQSTRPYDDHAIKRAAARS